tara:strand:+ start:7745 stop:8476 length:732 start_codon:yes stop_codon:yes gene_type:complete
MSKIKDKGYAPERWAFDEKVTDVFEDMLDRSIPQHRVMRQTVTSLVSNYIQPRFDTGAIYDIGCSRGEMISLLNDKISDRNFSYKGFEISEPMYDAAEKRFNDTDNVSIHKNDLKQGLPAYPESVVAITSVLTLMFVPMEYRQNLLSEIYNQLEDEGIFVLVEKVLGAENELNQVMSDSYYEMKRNNGYTEEDITRKKLSLEGVLVPVTTSTNIEMLQNAGFQKIDCFWRWMNFSGFVAIKYE